MRPRRVASLIKKAGEVFTASPDTTFHGYLNDSNELSVTVDVPVGSIVNRKRDGQQWLVTDRASNRLYTDLKVEKITATADVLRFTAGIQRDSFGRELEAAPAIIYEAMPVHIASSSRSKVATTKDRAATENNYTVLTSAEFVIQPQDRLNVNGIDLVVTAILIAQEGLTEVTAQAVT